VEPDRLQHDRPAACVSAQDYSSNTVASLRFQYSDKQNWRPSQKCYFFSCFNFWNVASLKLRNLKFHKAGNFFSGIVQCNPVILTQLHKLISLRYTDKIMPPSNHSVVKTDSKPWHASKVFYVIEFCICFSSWRSLCFNWTTIWLRNVGERVEEFEVENKFYPLRPYSNLHNSSVVSEWLNHIFVAMATTVTV